MNKIINKLVIFSLLLTIGLGVAIKTQTTSYSGSWMFFQDETGMWHETLEYGWEYEYVSFSVGVFRLEMIVSNMEETHSLEQLGRIVAVPPEYGNLAYSHQPIGGAQLNATIKIYDEYDSLLWSDKLINEEMYYLDDKNQAVYEVLFDPEKPTGYFAIDLEKMGNFGGEKVVIEIPVDGPSAIEPPAGAIDFLNEQTYVYVRRTNIATFWVGDEIYDTRYFNTQSTYPDETPPMDGLWEFVDWYFVFGAGHANITIYREHNDPQSFMDKDIDFYARYGWETSTGYIFRGSAGQPLPGYFLEGEYTTRLPDEISSYLSAVGWHNYAGYLIIFSVIVFIVVISLALLKLEPMLILLVVAVLFGFFMFLNVLPPWATISLASFMVVCFVLLLRSD